MLPLSGVVLAAGLGTRLRPLTEHRPKPLVPVAGVPLVEYGLAALARLGIRDIAVNCHHLGAQLPRALAHRPERIRFLDEPELQGTGGGLRGLAPLVPAGTLVVVNGDALFGFDLAPLLAAHRASGAAATLVLRDPAPDEPYGRVAIDPTGALQRIAEVRGREPDRPDLRFGVFTGVQIVEPALVAALPPVGACDVLRTAYADLMHAGASLRGVFAPPGVAWVDVGTPERYLAANRAVLTGRLDPPPGLPAADAAGVRVASGAHVAPGARLEGPCAVLSGARIGAGARIGPGTVVDRDARVAPGADLEGCVLWPGARAEGRLRDEVRTGQSS